MAQAGCFPYDIENTGGVTRTLKGKAPATTVISIGDPLTRDADGYMALMVSGGQCDGVAASAVASGDAGQHLEYWDPSIAYIVKTAVTTPTYANVGDMVDFSTATTGAFVVDVNVSTNDDFRIIGFEYPNDPAESGTIAVGDGAIGYFTTTSKNVNV